MTASERYAELYHRTDPTDPLVAAEIARGARWSYGKTDVHDHLPRLRAASRGSVLEIGVRFGSSTAALLAGVEDNGGHVWSVDTEDCSALFGGHPQWTFIRMDSSRQAAELMGLLPASLELLFVDGDHSLEGALSDLRNFGPMAKIVMCHDVDPDTGTPAVAAAVEHYMSSGAAQRSRQLFAGSHGLAVLS